MIQHLTMFANLFYNSCDKNVNSIKQVTKSKPFIVIKEIR